MENTTHGKLNSITENYSNIKEKYLLKIKKLKNKSLLFSWLRLFTFIAIIVFPILLWDISVELSIAILIVTIVVFALLIKKSINIKNIITKQKFIVEFADNELKATNGDWSVFYNGKEFINPHDDYSHDLDIFGERSFFQYINRTCTLEGQNELAALLNNPFLNTEKIVNRQQTLKELSENLDFRINFYSEGKVCDESSEDIKRINNIKNYKPFALNNKVIKFLTIFMPALFFITLITLFFGYFSALPGIIFIVNLIIIGNKLKEVNKVNTYFTSLNNILNKYSELTKLVCNQKFDSKELSNIKNDMLDKNYSAPLVIKQLSKLMGNFDQRNGILAGVLLNGILLWDLQYTLKIEKWLSKYSSKLNNWIFSIHQIDMMNSMAGYVYNHPDFVFPEINKEKVYQAKMIGHPLLDSKKRICSDFNFNKSKFILITGANMSGKSTFLRTIGLNMVLARCGMTVCAKELSFTPMRLITNMRTADSLMDNESYFFAELKRLLYIIEQLKQGEEIFIILDEILKGTNSNDKAYGSRELIKHLLKLKANGMIATHDLELGNLENEYNGIIRNMCFEVENKNDELIFDYKLREGLTQNHNATFLMRKMGII